MEVVNMLFQERESHVLIYIGQIIELSVWCRKTTLSEWYDHNMHIDLCNSICVESLSGW